MKINAVWILRFFPMHNTVFDRAAQNPHDKTKTRLDTER